MFSHVRYDLPKSERIDTDSGRFYACPDKKGNIFYYPSVTSILASDESKQHILTAWKDAVGEEYAAKVTLQQRFCCSINGCAFAGIGSFLFTEGNFLSSWEM